MRQRNSEAPRTVTLSRVFSKWIGRRGRTFSTSSRKPRWPSVNARSSGMSCSCGEWPAVSALLHFSGGPVRASSFGWEAWS